MRCACLALLLASCAPAGSAAPAAGAGAAVVTVSGTPPRVSAGAGRAAASSGALAPPLAEHHVPGCRVRVEGLLEAHVYAGSPSSPMKRAMFPPGSGMERFAAAHDHGAGYLACTWLVWINGEAYSYPRSSRWGPYDLNLTAQACSEPAEARAAVEAVVELTRNCTDLRAGEYYGERLEPLGGSPPPPAR